MLARIQECILYRGFSNGEILDDMTELINLYEADEEALKAREDQFFKSVNGLVELAGMYGFSGNIWHTYLTFLLVNHENAFSMASEIRGAIKGSINDLAKNDFQIFKELYDFDITVFDKVFGTGQTVPGCGTVPYDVQYLAGDGLITGTKLQQMPRSIMSHFFLYVHAASSSDVAFFAEYRKHEKIQAPGSWNLYILSECCFTGSSGDPGSL